MLAKCQDIGGLKFYFFYKLLVLNVSKGDIAFIEVKFFTDQMWTVDKEQCSDIF